MDGMGRGIVTRGGTRMAPAPAGDGEGSRRTTFAVGRLTWQRSEIRMIEPKRLEARHFAGWEVGGAETVH